MVHARQAQQLLSLSPLHPCALLTFPSVVPMALIMTSPEARQCAVWGYARPPVASATSSGATTLCSLAGWGGGRVCVLQ